MAGSLQSENTRTGAASPVRPLKAQGAVATVLRFSPQSIEQHMRAEADRIDDDHPQPNRRRRFARHQSCIPQQHEGQP